MTGAVRIPVLMYHRVGEACNGWEARYAISARNFRAHMEGLLHAGFHAVSVDAMLAYLEGERQLEEGAFVLTFDDGFRGVREHALPVLESLGWPFTVFLVSGLIGGEDVWTRHTNPSGRCYELLSADDIREMERQGVCLQSHSCTHPRLSTLDDVTLNKELLESRQVLTTMLGTEVCYLAYPYGDVDERVEAAARRAGYVAAFSTQSGFNRPDVNRFRIRRLEVYGTDTLAMLLRKIRLGCNDGSLVHMASYYVGRAASRFVTGGAR